MEMVAVYTIEEEPTLEENTPNMPIRRFPSSSSSWLSKVILFNMLLIINFDNHQNYNICYLLWNEEMSAKCKYCGKKLEHKELTHCSDECLFSSIKKSKPFRGK